MRSTSTFERVGVDPFGERTDHERRTAAAAVISRDLLADQTRRRQFGRERADRTAVEA
jgi:hypothetical protein